MKRRFLLLFIGASSALLAGFIGCTERLTFGSVAGRKTINKPSPCNASDGNEVCDQWANDGKFNTQAASLIFYVDISGSMQDNIQGVSSAASQVGKKLADLGFSNMCFGVIPGYGVLSTVSGYDKIGKLYSANGDPANYCVCVSDNTPDAVQSKMYNNFKTLFDDTAFIRSGSNEELEDFAVYKAFSDPAIIAANENLSNNRCFGDDIATFNAVVGDEASMRASRSYNGYNFSVEGTTTDLVLSAPGLPGHPISSETKARAEIISTKNTATGKYDTFLTTDLIKQTVDAYRGTLNSSYIALVHLVDPDGPNNAEEDGKGYLEDADAFGSPKFEIQDANFNNPTKQQAFIDNIVTNLTPFIKDNVTYFSIFDTSDEMCTTKPIFVTADGEDVSSHVNIINPKRIEILYPYYVAKSIIKAQYTKKSSPDCQ